MPAAPIDRLPGSSTATRPASTWATPTAIAAHRAHRWRPRRGFVIALVLSLAIHTGFWWWPVELPETPDTVALQATIIELPPPPLPPVAAAQPQPEAAPKRSRAPRIAAPRPVVRTAPPEPVPDVAPSAPASESMTPAPPAAAAPTASAVATPPVAEVTELPPPLPAVPAKTLPPRVDLVYRVFLGTRGFYIGDATYRFEHSGNRYRIATVGEARGLAALILRGQGKVESRGLITAAGLQPDEFALERGRGRKREVAQFDWETGIVALDGDKTAPLELPTYDPLAFLWQFYFLPPATGEQTFAIATTRKITHYTFRREGQETILLPGGEVHTERWHRRSDDGTTDAFVWLAPTMHYVAVKLRFATTERGTVEALLDAIHVDPSASLDGAVARPPGRDGSESGVAQPVSTTPSSTPRVSESLPTDTTP